MQTLELPITIDQLVVINDEIDRNISDDFRNIQRKIELVIEEVLTNNCKYVSNSNISKINFSIGTINFDNEICFCVTIADFGPEFDPFMSVKAPNLELSVEERPIGGLGIYLIKNIVSHYIYSRIDDKNVIQLIFSKKNNVDK